MSDETPTRRRRRLYWTTFLVTGMLVTGTVNTLLTKLQDLTCVRGCEAGGQARYFEQPIWQSLNMFLGESCCLLVYFATVQWKRHRKRRALPRSREELLWTAPDPGTPSISPLPEHLEPGQDEEEEEEEEQVTVATVHEVEAGMAGEHDPRARSRTSSWGALERDLSAATLLPPSRRSLDAGAGEMEEGVLSLEGELASARPSALPLRGLNCFLLFLPTMCDLTAATLMNIGLIYTAASIYQMLRGSVVLFTGILSTLFLGRRHPLYRWLALGIVASGILVVGLSSLVGGQQEPVPGEAPPAATSSTLGILLVVLAQCFTACQFVVEERILSRHKVPALLAVGLEGVFGLVTVLLSLPLLQLLGRGQTPGGFLDIVEGWRQVTQHPQVYGAAIGIIFSIASFNWFGLSVTKRISATSRSTIDTCRTFFIWMASLSLGWESFKAIQVLGFAILICGTLVYNDVVVLPGLAPRRSAVRLA